MKICAVIPAYNAELYVKRAIESVFHQTCQPDEIIVVDDGSTDRTGDIVKEYGGSVRYIYQENQGVSTARNRGIQEATGEWIAFLDADDEWLPERLEKQRQVLERNPELVWAGSNYLRISNITKKCSSHIIPNKAIKLLQGKDYFEDYFRAFLIGTGGWTGTMIIKREVLLQIGLFDENLHDGEEDTDLWMRIAYRWPEFGFVAQPLAVYHIDFSNSLTRQYKSVTVLKNFLDRHSQLSRENGQWARIKPVFSYLLHLSIRSMLFENRKVDIRELLKQYANHLSWMYRSFIYLLTAVPMLTVWGCHAISKVVRFFHLRRRVVPLPKKLK